MNNILKVILALAMAIPAYGQIDTQQLALDVSKADAENTSLLKDYIWKRYSTAFVNGEQKATVISEFSFDENGEIQVRVVGGESSIKQKPGIRGRIQENAVEDKLEYVAKALELALAYTYMSKGQLLDFMEKATISEKDGVIEASGNNIYVQGDKLTILIDAQSKLFLSRKFSSTLGKDALDGEIEYGKLSSGINYATKTILNLPARKARIEAVNKDFTQRVR